MLARRVNYMDVIYSGNRLTEDLNSSSLKTYSYDTANPTDPSHHLLETVNGGTTTYSYDDNGNTTDNTDYQFTYGDNNRVKTAEQSSTVLATYTYNGRGERVKKASSSTTLYLYDQRGQLIAELDDTGATIKEYAYVDGQPLALIDGSGVNLIHTNHLNTPQRITDENQTVVWDATYTPFGEATILTETITNNLRFPGQLYDAETGLHYNGARYYCPECGRYTQSDPLGQGAGTNTYIYTVNNPVKYIDPTGLLHTVAASRISPQQSDTVAAVFCDGNGGFEVVFYKKLKECTGDCIRRHESVHIQDFRTDAPWICRNKPKSHTIAYDNISERNHYEGRAYRKELSCLRNPLQCFASDCSLEIQLRKLDILTRLRNLR